MNNKLSYLTARAPKSNVQFRLCLRENKRYNGSHLQFHDCQVHLLPSDTVFIILVYLFHDI